MALFEKERHEPLKHRPWDEREAHAVIERIVADTLESGGEHADWPFHPLDRVPGLVQEMPRTLYFGTAGIVWALEYLREAGATSQGRDWSFALDSLRAQFPAGVEGWKPSPHSYLLGNSAPLLLQYKLQRSPEIARTLAESVEANMGDETHDFMWSEPGTMLAALFMLDWTREERWRDLFLRGAGLLWDGLEPAKQVRCRLWAQNLYGRRVKMTGAVHGFAGNAFPIVKGLHLLPDRRRSEWLEAIATTLSATALHEGGCCNWPPSVDVDPAARMPPLVQYCHGAPGMIVCLASLPDDAAGVVRRLFDEGGELVWTAGPVTKGSNLCHGTGGNGYAFLRLYERTGEERWLSRARLFAMHAIDQFESAAEQYGQLRYSLWTGDLGLAVYLWDCIRGVARFPTLDVF
jgi:hypothetical protein